MKWPYKKAERKFRQRYLTRALIAAQLNVTRAAKIIGWTRTSLQNALVKYGVNRARIKSRDIHRVQKFDVEFLDWQKRFIKRALARCGNSPTECARLTGLHRASVYRLSDRVGIRLPRVQNNGNAAWKALNDLPSPATREASRPLVGLTE
jgi:DNA-binding NtrC family response regulator